MVVSEVPVYATRLQSSPDWCCLSFAWTRGWAKDYRIPVTTALGAYTMQLQRRPILRAYLQLILWATPLSFLRLPRIPLYGVLLWRLAPGHPVVDGIGDQYGTYHGLAQVLNETESTCSAYEVVTF